MREQPVSPPFHHCHVGHDLTKRGAYLYGRSGFRSCRSCIHDARPELKKPRGKGRRRAKPKP